MNYDSREASRRKWDVGSADKSPSLEALNFGSFQRIADACELMAKNHAALVEERDSYERLYWESRQCEKTQGKQIAAYKGIIRRLKARAGGAQ